MTPTETEVVRRLVEALEGWLDKPEDAATYDACLLRALAAIEEGRALLTAPQAAGEWVMVPRSAVDWLKKHNPVLCEKAGLAAAPPQAAPAGESFWLIERGANERQSPTCWWAGMDAFGDRWAPDVHNAVQFQSKAMAELMARARHMTVYAVTSHNFIDAAPPQAAQEPADEPEQMMAQAIEGSERIWTCKIGGKVNGLPKGADGPMRRAVQECFARMTGYEAEFCFSGWGGELTEPERAVVENRLPRRAAQSGERRPMTDEAQVLRSLLGAALGALRYHTEQTRPIQRTKETIAAIERELADHGITGEPTADPLQALTDASEKAGLEP